MTDRLQNNARIRNILTLIAVVGVLFAIGVALWRWFGPIALTLLIPLTLAVGLAAHDRVLRRLDRIERRVRNDVLGQTQALHAIHTLLPLRSPLPPMGRYTIDPDFAALLVSTIFEHRPRHVLELGSGVSTLIIAYALQAIGGGELTSVDENERYRDTTLAHLRRHGFDGAVRMILAPLVEQPLGDARCRWYDTMKLTDLPETDLLIVDGPSGRSGPLARRPALPLLWHKLRSEAVIVMDDADRDDERRIVDDWRGLYPSLQCEHVPTRKGAYVLLRGRD